MTPSGTLTTLYSFCSQGDCDDGVMPRAGLVQATDGNLYGTTSLVGANGGGTVFVITPTAIAIPLAGLVQDTNGNFYGTTWSGGANQDGTVFSLSVGLGPFVETQPASGKVGAAVRILGTNLAGATSVTFNGTAAGFRVVSNSLITTSVPVAATTGTVQVITPSRKAETLSSNVPFRVQP